MFSPEIVRIGPFTIKWYGVLLATAFLTGIYSALFLGRKFGLDQEKLGNLLLPLAVTLLVGGRLGHVVTRLSYYSANPLAVFKVNEGGMGSHGAILLSLFAGYFLVKRQGLAYWQVADVTAPGIAIGHVFVRLGNFINGELYGPPTDLPWGVRFPGTLLPHHPSQLYEALAALVLLPLIFVWSGNRKFPGQVFLRALLAMSAIRFLVDFLRQNTTLIGPLILTQWLALALILFTSVLLVWFRYHTQ